MITTNLKSILICISYASLCYSMSCTSSDDPMPVNCETSNLAVSVTSADPTSCAASNGSITVVSTGGDAPYQFAIDNQSFGTSARFEGLGAGTYTIKLKDKNGCERATSVILNPLGSTLAASLQITDSGCKTNNGAVIVAAVGGESPYSYSLNGGTPITTNAFFGLTTGNYTIKVIDNTGCSITQTVTVFSGIKYNTEIKRIIDTYCAITACHMEGGNISFKVLANIQSSAKDVKSRTQSGNMPKNGIKLPQADIDAIACWVDDGARDN